MRWWAVGAGLLLALDVATAPAVPETPVPIFAGLLAYVVSFAILFAATVGDLLWAPDLTAIRSIAEATEVARRQGLTGPVEGLCVGAVRPEYFAQVSKIIPLLLVDLGIERRFFEQQMREPVQRALTMFTVLLLCAAEAAATRCCQGATRAAAGCSATGWSTRPLF